MSTYHQQVENTHVVGEMMTLESVIQMRRRQAGVGARSDDSITIYGIVPMASHICSLSKEGSTPPLWHFPEKNVPTDLGSTDTVWSVKTDENLNQRNECYCVNETCVWIVSRVSRVHKELYIFICLITLYVFRLMYFQRDRAEIVCWVFRFSGTFLLSGHNIQIELSWLDSYLGVMSCLMFFNSRMLSHVYLGWGWLKFFPWIKGQSFLW